MLLGVKATTRGSRFSLFGTVRPGYVRWSHGQVVSLRMPLLDGPLVYSYRARTNFGVDLGVGLEHALKTRMRVRVEMGDTVMWWHHYDTNHLDPPPFLSTISSSLRLTTGIFYSFGAGIPIQPTEAVPNAHRFFDKPNVALFSAGLLAQAADSITTQRRIGQCHKQSVGSDINCVQLEANPLARPFVVHGWGGQIAIDAISDAAQVSVALALHRLGHHTIERFVTVPATVLGAVYSYRSLQGHW